MIVEQIMNAILLGCTYTLVAIGFSLFFGVLDVVVFCSGDIAIFGAFSIIGSYILVAGVDAALPVTVLALLMAAIAAILCAAFGLLTYYVSIKPFEKSSPLMPLLSTIALGMVIREGLGNFFPKGRNPQAFPDLVSSGALGNTMLFSFRNLFIISVTVVILILLFTFLNRTKIGQSMQAIAQNKELAYMTGINIRRTVSVTFILGGVLLSLAGFLIGAYYGVLRFDGGSMYGIKGFSAAVVGGLRSIYGAVVGGMLLGFIEVFVAGYIKGGTAFASAIAFVVVVIFMVLKPEGILGEKTVEKV